MAEFMKERARIVEAQKAGLARRRLHEIQDVDDDRQDFAIELFLIAISAHPGTAMLRGAREIIADEEANGATVPIAHRPGACIGMIERDILALLERQAEKLPGGIEGGGDHLLQRQIRLESRLIEIELGLAALLGIIAPVPGLKREIAALGRDKLLQLAASSRKARARPRVQTSSSRLCAAAGLLAI